MLSLFFKNASSFSFVGINRFGHTTQPQRLMDAWDPIPSRRLQFRAYTKIDYLFQHNESFKDHNEIIVTHKEVNGTVKVGKRVFGHNNTNTPFLEFMEKQQDDLFNRLETLTRMEQTLEVGLEMAALVNLLKLFNHSCLHTQTEVTKAGAVAQQLYEELTQVKEKQSKLKEVVEEVLRLALK